MADPGGAAERETDWKRLQMTNAIVYHTLKAGGTAEDCAVALAGFCDDLVDRLKRLEAIAPYKARMPDGRMFIWRCPDELIPQRESPV